MQILVKNKKKKKNFEIPDINEFMKKLINLFDSNKEKILSKIDTISNTIQEIKVNVQEKQKKSKSGKKKIFYFFFKKFRYSMGT